MRRGDLGTVAVWLSTGNCPGGDERRPVEATGAHANFFAASDHPGWSGIDALQRHGIWSAGLDGTEREIHSSPVRVTLFDVRRDGGVLVSFDDLRTGLSAGSDAASREIDVSWFDGSVVQDLSADGSQVLFIEAHEAENPHYACYVRQFDGSPAVRIGDGSICRFSADGQWVVTIVNHPAHDLVLYPTGFGEPRPVSFDGIDRVLWAGFHPDGRHLFAVGSTAARPRRLYMIPLAGEPRRIFGRHDAHPGHDRFETTRMHGLSKGSAYVIYASTTRNASGPIIVCRGAKSETPSSAYGALRVATLCSMIISPLAGYVA